MHRALLPALALIVVATPAAADMRFLSYDPADRVTTTLTRGLTLQVERGWFGSITVHRLISTAARGSAAITQGGPNEALRALPEGAAETDLYTVGDTGDARGLARALCPGAAQTYLVMSRVRVVRPLTVQAVGRWPDGQYRHCVALSYDYRGEWAMPPAGAMSIDDDVVPARPD